MAYLLGDVFIGNFPKTQLFGEHPEIYSQRWPGLKGHNGVDFGCPSQTKILSAADGWVSEIGFDTGGYGKYIKIVHDGYLTLYGHLNDCLVNIKDKVVCGQLIGHSNNTGLSTAPHLHFGIAPCDTNGNKLETQNGFFGYIDPMGDRCHWMITNLQVPNLPPANIKSPVSVPSDQFVDLVTKSANFDVVAAHFQMTEAEKLSPKQGDLIVTQIEALEEKTVELQHKLDVLAPYLGVPASDGKVFQSDSLIIDQKTSTNLLSSIYTNIRDFIFTK